jgi:cytochrome c oxidase subunit II
LQIFSRYLCMTFHCKSLKIYGIVRSTIHPQPLNTRKNFMMLSRFLVFITLTFILGLAQNAFAALPEPLQLNLQPAASTVMNHIHDFHNFILYIIFGIAIFVLLLMIYVVVRFNAKANPIPSKTSHNVPLEIVWTIVPVLILVVIAIPSFRLLYYESRFDKPEMTVKATGYQWYWGYDYPDHGGINFMSYMIKDKDIDRSKGQHRLLSTDNPVVIPVDTVIRFQVTAADVLHAFAVPAFGIKTDAVPGRLNETWVKVTKPGTYYGQCSELCGTGHAFMPIEIKAVSKEEFAAWVKEKGGTMPSDAPADAPAVTDASAPAAAAIETTPAQAAAETPADTSAKTN